MKILAEVCEFMTFKDYIHTIFIKGNCFSIENSTYYWNITLINIKKYSPSWNFFHEKKVLENHKNQWIMVCMITLFIVLFTHFISIWYICRFWTLEYWGHLISNLPLLINVRPLFSILFWVSLIFYDFQQTHLSLKKRNHIKTIP